MMMNPKNMSSNSLKVGDYHPTQKWNPLDLILIRSKCDVGIIRCENALQQNTDRGVFTPPETLKNTEELIETLHHAMVALQDLEGERNIANQNSILERVAHTKTMIQLQESQKQVQKLTQEGESLRSSLAKFMR